MKLDLGGTACYENPNDVIISIDGTTMGDHVTPLIIADYNNAPFLGGTFDEAFGSCYFETSYDLRELYRLLKKGGRAYLSSCEELTPEEEATRRQMIREQAKAVGFRVRMLRGDGFPRVFLYK